MKKITHFLGISATIVTLGLAVNALALETQPEQPVLTNSQSYPLTHLRADKGWKREQLTEKLNLTAQQQEQVQNIRSQYYPQISSLKENIRSERQKLAEMMKSNQSESDLRSQHAKIIDLDQQIHSLRFESMLEIREVLTQEQRQKWAELMGEYRGRHRGRYRSKSE